PSHLNSENKMKSSKAFKYKPYYGRFEKPESKRDRYKSTEYNHTFETQDNSTFSSMDSANNEKWLQHLFDAMAEDEGNYYSNYYEGETYDSKSIVDKIQAEQQRSIRYEQAKQLRLQEIRRASYFASWNQFDINGQSSIEFKDIPWPTANIKKLSKGDVEDFLLSGVENNSEIRSILRQEQIRFHPDRWHRWIRRIPTEIQKKKIMETVTEVSRTINVLCEERM
ncbi:3223_t:CDS:2, partial [Scutellospora calospora]